SVATSSRLLCLISVISQYSSINFVHTLSLHDALPISLRGEPQVEARGGEEAVVPGVVGDARAQAGGHAVVEEVRQGQLGEVADADRKSTRLNSSHVKISYAVFCLKKKTLTPLF